MKMIISFWSHILVFLIVASKCLMSLLFRMSWRSLLWWLVELGSCCQQRQLHMAAAIGRHPSWRFQTLLRNLSRVAKLRCTSETQKVHICLKSGGVVMIIGKIVQHGLSISNRETIDLQVRRLESEAARRRFSSFHSTFHHFKYCST